MSQTHIQYPCITWKHPTGGDHAKCMGDSWLFEIIYTGRETQFRPRLLPVQGSCTHLWPLKCNHSHECFGNFPKLPQRFAWLILDVCLDQSKCATHLYGHGELHLYFMKPSIYVIVNKQVIQRGFDSFEAQEFQILIARVNSETTPYYCKNPGCTLYKK